MKKRDNKRKTEDLDKKFREELEAFKKWGENCDEAAERQYHDEQDNRVFSDDDDF